MRFQLQPGTTLDDLLDLPWSRPLAAWEDGALTPDGVGVCRLDLGGVAHTLRELSAPDAERAHDLLRALGHEGLPVVEVAGTVVERTDVDGRPLPAVLVTRPPAHARRHHDLLALPSPAGVGRVLEAAATLLVQLHVAGVAWGAPSLARMRFRRDAGRVGAVLADVGPATRHDELTRAQRLADLEAAATTIADELTGGVGGEDADPHGVRHEVRRHYLRLWDELTRPEQVDGGGAGARLQRVNELGFDVEEVEIADEGDGLELRLGPGVLEPGHHRRRLQQLTGLVVQENQARRLLHDIDRFHATHHVADAEDAESSAAVRWLHEVFHPAVAAVPAELRREGQDDAEVFHEVLEHRYYLSERVGHDVGTPAAVDAYVTEVLRPQTVAPAVDGGGAVEHP